MRRGRAATASPTLAPRRPTRARPVRLTTGVWRARRCSICGKQGGACIQCKAPRCLTAFHASCARQAGVHMVEKEKVKDGVEYVDLQVLCDKHRPVEGGKKRKRKRDNKW